MRNGNDRPFGWSGGWSERRIIVFAGLILLSVLTYAPFLHLPPMQDDYLQIELAERYGSPSGWGGLLQDPLYRCRATSILMSAATIQLFGWSVLVFHLSSLAVHALNVLLIAALGFCRPIGWKVSVAAAFVFAVRERHHEAVVWYASLHEPMVLLFCLLAVLSLSRWLEGGRAWWLAATGIAWLLALASKESGVALAAILPAFAWLYPEKRKAVAPLALAGSLSTATYFLLAASGQAEHQHFHDGTFAIGGHAATAFLNSALRGIWIWGGLALIVLWLFRKNVNRAVLGFGAIWFACGLAPYMFLTYMPRIPSRHHYIASVGMALLVAVAFGALVQWRQATAHWVVLLAMTFIGHNWIYLWVSKLPQFEQRAALIEDFVGFVAEKPGSPVANGCSDLNSGEARNAIRMRLGLDPAALLPDHAGPEVRVYRCSPPGS